MKLIPRKIATGAAVLLAGAAMGAGTVAVATPAQSCHAGDHVTVTQHAGQPVEQHSKPVTAPPLTLSAAQQAQITKTEGALVNAEAQAGSNSPTADALQDVQALRQAAAAGQPVGPAAHALIGLLGTESFADFGAGHSYALADMQQLEAAARQGTPIQQTAALLSTFVSTDNQVTEGSTNSHADAQADLAAVLQAHQKGANLQEAGDRMTSLVRSDLQTYGQSTVLGIFDGDYHLGPFS